MRLVSKVLHVPNPPKTRHYVGFPPELAPSNEKRYVMQAPDILLIEQRDEGFFLFRFTVDGVAVGDTWHLNLDSAKGVRARNGQYPVIGILSVSCADPVWIRFLPWLVRRFSRARLTGAAYLCRFYRPS